VKSLLAVLLALGACAAAHAQADAEAPDLWTRMERYRLDIRLNPDGTNVRTHDFAYKVLKEQALEGARTFDLSHSTSVEALEVLEAFTRKADGRKLPVSRDSYQLNVNSGAGGNPAFSDRTTLTVVFPEVAVGDTLELRYKVEQKEAIFPGHFSLRETFGTSYPYDDVRVTIDAPAEMKAQYAAQGGFKQKVSEKKGRRIVEWTWKNPKPVKSKRRDWSVFEAEKEPGYVYSTFDTYAQIAEAYGVRARPKAVPTERVRKLAGEIVGKRTDRREQVRALYDWVATKVDYAGNCIGVGVVVPRDLDFVLENKMGDCKDHATLLQALLAARGIPSVQALVNAGSSYRLAKVPVVSEVNHVITYVPEFDLFLDSTSDSTPLGLLPMQVQDKPVLLVDGFRDGARTPPTPIGTNRQAVKTVVDIADDGSIKAKLDIRQQGLFAAITREGMRNFPKDQEADFIKNMLRSRGVTGSGKLSKEDPTALVDTYQYGVSMEIKEFMQRPGAGAFSIVPLFGTPAAIHGFVMSAFASDEDHESACTSGHSVEEYTYRLPADMEVLSKPDNLSVANDFLSYDATYELKGRELTVKRTFDDRTQGNVCAPAVQAAYRDFAKKVLPNLKAQVLYK
jgi:hypothetical protein